MGAGVALFVVSPLCPARVAAAADRAASVRGTWCGFWRTNPVIRMSRAPWSARDCRRARSVAGCRARHLRALHPGRPRCTRTAGPGCRDRKAAVPASGLRLLERGPLGSRVQEPLHAGTRIGSTARLRTGSPRQTMKCTKDGCKPGSVGCMSGAGLSQATLGKTPSDSQPFSRTGENPPSGMVGGIEETSASCEARYYAPRSHPTACSLFYNHTTYPKLLKCEVIHVVEQFRASCQIKRIQSRQLVQ